MQRYLNANIWFIFLTIISFYAVSLFIEYKFIFTDKFFVQALNVDESFCLQCFFESHNKSAWINYLLILVVVWFPSLSISFCFKIGAILKNVHVSYFKLVDLVLKAQLIFAINYFVFTILKWKQIIVVSYSNMDNPFIYQSVLAFFSLHNIPFWLLHPLQLLSVCEFFHFLFVSYGISKLFSYSFASAVKFYLLFYGIALFFWVAFSFFLITFS